MSIDDVTPITQIGVKFMTEDRFISGRNTRRTRLEPPLLYLPWNGWKFKPKTRLQNLFVLQRRVFSPKYVQTLRGCTSHHRHWGCLFPSGGGARWVGEMLHLELSRKRRACLNAFQKSSSSDPQAYLVVKRHGKRGAHCRVGFVRGGCEGGGM